MIAVFLQVRLDSSRLPRKALEMLGSLPVVQRCMKALDEVEAHRRVVVTEPQSADELAPLVKACGWDLFVGDKEDVLDRFVQAARWSTATTLVRATGDNPLVSAELANRLLSEHLSVRADYSGYQGIPVGTGVEVVQTRALEWAWSHQPDAYEREHVSPYLYRRPDEFVLHRPVVEPPLYAPQSRVTLDTREDLDYLRKLWNELNVDRPLKIEEFLPWLTRNPR